MKRLGWILAVLALGAAGYFFWFRAEHYVNLPPLAGRTWLAFGDSLTSGYGASEGHDYPTLLGAKLGVKIINQGRAGETSQDGLARIDQTILLDPRVVLICFGGNDTLQAIPREQTIANVGAMVDRFVAHGSFVVLIGIRSASVRDKNESLFKSLAREKQILYVPNFLKGVFGSPDLMSDYVHPNDAGYEFVATRLEGILQPFMPQL
ncbi:MAG: family lipase [Verrucomicrobiales bacterium]|nr:family lipase [Verrucomicrobiales bacterium]